MVGGIVVDVGNEWLTVYTDALDFINIVGIADLFAGGIGDGLQFAIVAVAVLDTEDGAFDGGVFLDDVAFAVVGKCGAAALVGGGAQAADAAGVVFVGDGEFGVVVPAFAGFAVDKPLPLS